MAILEILGGVSSLGGLLGASAAKARAERAREEALNRMAAENDAAYREALIGNERTLYGMAGQGGDALAALGGSLGGALAGAGVYNSSAVAGALQSAQRDSASQLADVATRLQSGARRDYLGGKREISRIGLGYADGNQQQATAEMGAARGGLMSFLGSMAQSNLMKSGANSARVGTPAVNGTTGQGAALPGNGFGSFLPAMRMPSDYFGSGLNLKQLLPAYVAGR